MRNSPSNRRPQSRTSSGARQRQGTARGAPQRPKAAPRPAQRSAARPPAKRQPGRRPVRSDSPWPRIIRNWGEALIIAVFFVLLLYAVFWPVRYDGVAMEPTIRNGDRIFISRLAALFNMLNHGDIVIFRHEYGNLEIDSIARIVGMPGDRVSISGGVVFRNGLPLQEDYLVAGMTTHPEQEIITLGSTEFFVMVDNRFTGGDSRQFGTITGRDIYARALIRFNRIGD